MKFHTDIIREMFNDLSVFISTDPKIPEDKKNFISTSCSIIYRLMTAGKEIADKILKSCR